MILTAEQARKILRCYSSIDDMPGEITEVWIPAIDAFIQNATGKDWGILTDTYTKIDPIAIAAASILLVQWAQDPGMSNKIDDSGVIGFLGQLKAKYQQEFAG
jgi:hypothetical protein